MSKNKRRRNFKSVQIGDFIVSSDTIRHLDFSRRFSASHTTSTEGCWKWVGYKLKFGYGQIYDGVKRKNVLAHRAAWELFVGDIPKDLLVLHRCDNPSCVNPEHLFLGTDDENVKDCLRKGRHRNGSGKRGYCKKGHILIENNIKTYPCGVKVCLICNPHLNKSKEKKKCQK